MRLTRIPPVRSGSARNRSERVGNRPNTGGAPAHELRRVIHIPLRMTTWPGRLVLLGCLVLFIGGVRLLTEKVDRFQAIYGGLSHEPGSRDPALASDEGAVLYPPELLPGETHQFVKVTVTGYTSSPDQTDDTPFITATSQPTRPGTLALSRDLLRTFTRGARFDFGDRVLIPGMGIYVVEDTMHPRWQRRADIWFHDDETARRWGRREVFLTKVDADEPHLVAEQWHPADAYLPQPDAPSYTSR